MTNINGDKNNHEGIFFIKGPDFDFEFAVNDAFIFNLYSFRILVFKIDDQSKEGGHAKATSVLKQGLQGLVERCPPLGGVVVSVPDEQLKPGQQPGWKKAIPGPGIKLVVKDLRAREELKYSTLEERDFPPSAFKSEDVVPIPLAPVTEGEAPGSVFQFTWIQGGALLTVAIDHPIADGNGMNVLMGLLAAECRAVQLQAATTNGVVSSEAEKKKPVVGMDKALVLALEEKTLNKPEDHPSYTFLDEPPPPASHENHGGENSHAAEHPETPHLDMYMFQIPAEKLIELKKAASPDDGLRISTHDAFCALTWRSVMLARYHAGTITDLDEVVDFQLPTNVRTLVGLKKDWIGNMVYFITNRMKLRDLLQPNSLPIVAKQIRTNLNARTPSRIAGFQTLMKSLPTLHHATFGFIATCLTTTYGMGSSWKADEMYGAVWGDAFGGRAKKFRSPDVGFFGVFQGLVFLCPPMLDGERDGEKGTAEFQIWFEPAGWEAVRKDGLLERFCRRIPT